MEKNFKTLVSYVGILGRQQYLQFKLKLLEQSKNVSPSPQRNKKKYVPRMNEKQKVELNKILSEKVHLSVKMKSMEKQQQKVQEKLQDIDGKIHEIKVELNHYESQKHNIGKIHTQVYNDKDHKLQAEDLVKKMNQQRKEKERRAGKQRDKLFQLLEGQFSQLSDYSKEMMQRQEKRRMEVFLEREKSREKKKLDFERREKESKSFIKKIHKDFSPSKDVSLPNIKPQMDPLLGGLNKRQRFNEVVKYMEIRPKVTPYYFQQNYQPFL